MVIQIHSDRFQPFSVNFIPFKNIQNQAFGLQILMIKTRVIINQGLTEGQTLGNLLDIEAASTHAERMMFSPNYCSSSTGAKYMVKVLVG